LAHVDDLSDSTAQAKQEKCSDRQSQPPNQLFEFHLSLPVRGGRAVGGKLAAVVIEVDGLGKKIWHLPAQRMPKTEKGAPPRMGRRFA